jgi:hypothetical protein
MIVMYLSIEFLPEAAIVIHTPETKIVGYTIV